MIRGCKKKLDLVSKKLFCGVVVYGNGIQIHQLYLQLEAQIAYSVEAIHDQAAQYPVVKFF